MDATEPTSAATTSTAAPAPAGGALEPRPIIVAAMTRSGGKWLCNMLSNHSQISGIQHQIHAGVLETNFFGRIQRAIGDIRDVESYIALIELWAQSDFFKVAGIDKEVFYTVRPRPTDYMTLFAMLRRLVAQREGARYWVQKTSAVNAVRFLPQLPGSKLLLTSRDLDGRLASVLEMRRKSAVRLDVAKASAGYAVQSKLLKKLARTYPCQRTEYAALRSDAEGELRRICDYLDLEFEPQMLETRFTPNSSFKKSPRKPLTRFQRLFAHSVAALVRPIPLPLLMAGRWIGENREERFVRGTFLHIRREYDLR